MLNLQLVENLCHLLALRQIDLKNAAAVIYLRRIIIRFLLGGHLFNKFVDFCRRANTVHFWIRVDLELIIMAPVDHPLTPLYFERR
jgi:hypothetical protein